MKTITMDEARERVARGAAQLDRVKPGWHTRIDVGTLTLRDTCRCVVGQLTGGNFSLAAVGLPDFPFSESFEAGVAHGFSLNDPSRSRATSERLWKPLQDAWIEAIAARRHPVSEQETTAPRDSQLTYAVARAANRLQADTSRIG